MTNELYKVYCCIVAQESVRNTATPLIHVCCSNDGGIVYLGVEAMEAGEYACDAGFNIDDLTRSNSVSLIVSPGKLFALLYMY